MKNDYEERTQIFSSEFITPLLKIVNVTLVFALLVSLTPIQQEKLKGNIIRTGFLFYSPIKKEGFNLHGVLACRYLHLTISNKILEVTAYIKLKSFMNYFIRRIK